MDLESTITLVGFAGFAVALLGYLAAMKRDLRAEIAALGTGLTERFDTRLDASNALSGARVDGLESSMTARFESFESRMNARFETVDARFDSLESRMNARFEALDGRIDGLDSRIDGLGGRVDGLEGRISDLRADVRAGFTAVDARLVTLEQRTFDIGARRRPGAG